MTLPVYGPVFISRMKGKLLIVNFFILPLHICLFWTNEHIIIVSLWMEKTQFHSWIWWQPYIFLSIVGVCVSLCLSPHRSFILFKIVAYSISNKITYISFSPNHSLAGRRNSLETMVQCTNCTTEVQEREYDLEPFVFIVLLTGLICTGLNVLVFSIFLINRKLRQNPYHFLVLLLSFCDLLVGLGFIVYAIRKLDEVLIHSKVLCIVQMVLFANGILLSLFQTFLISLQRYLVICKTSWSNLLFQNSRKYIVCISNWMIIFIFTVGLISPPKDDKENNEIVCNVQYVYNINQIILEVFVRSSVVFLVMTVVLYCITISHVVKMNKKIVPKNTSASLRQDVPRSQQVASNSSMVQQHRQVRIAWESKNNHLPQKETSTCKVSQLPKKSVSSQAIEHEQITILRKRKIMNTIVLVGILMGFLVILSGPLIISLVVPFVPPLYLIVASVLCCLNSLVNPFIYCWKLPDLREALKSFFGKVFCCLWVLFAFSFCYMYWTLVRAWTRVYRVLVLDLLVFSFRFINTKMSSFILRDYRQTLAAKVRKTQLFAHLSCLSLWMYITYIFVCVCTHVEFFQTPII